MVFPFSFGCITLAHHIQFLFIKPSIHDKFSFLRNTGMLRIKSQKKRMLRIKKRWYKNPIKTHPTRRQKRAA